nr:hypothetical protein [Cytophagales bacterium]
MLSTNQSQMLVQNAAVIFIAALIAGAVFLADIKTDSSVAVASMYAVVILYSWLIPGKYTSMYAAAICSALTVISVLVTGELSMDGSTLSNLNMVISLVVIWTCVTLVLIAKSSFASLENINHQLSDSSAELFKKVRELDEQQEELSANKHLLESLNAHLIVKNRELERFTSIASHDLQEPLRTIGNMTQLITKKYYPAFDDQGRRMLDYINLATNRLMVLIKGLLEFSRIGNKRETEQVDCQELVSQIVLDFDAAIKELRGSVSMQRLPTVEGNPVELRTLFQNLISNGLKFHRPGVSPILEVSANDCNTHITFCIKDNGIGIDREDYEKIFLIFQRLHAKEEYEGTGLGLAYCRKIVELHGGKIWISSQVGEGSSFFFTLTKTYEQEEVFA